MSSVPLPAHGRTGTARTSRRTRGVAASTRFASPDPSGPGADRLRHNLRLLGAEPAEATPADGRRPR